MSDPSICAFSASSVTVSSEVPRERDLEESESSPRPPFPLYDDVLQPVLRCFNEYDLHIVAQLSTQWRDLLQSMRPIIGLTTHVQFNRNRLPLPNSVVGRHITNAPNIGDTLSINQVAKFFPNLVVLKLSWLDPSPFAEGPLTLPPLLQSFTIENVDVKTSKAVFDSLTSLAHLRHLSLCINLEFMAENLRRIDFSPLLALKQLQSFTLEFAAHDWSELAQNEVESLMPSTLVGFIRQMPLHEFNTSSPYSDRDFFVRFFEQVTLDCSLITAGNLTELKLKSLTLNNVLLRTLTRFPNLTSFDGYGLDLGVKDMQLFERFPNVTKLHATNFRYSKRTTSKAIAAACKALPNLRELFLSEFRLTTKDFDDCLKHLPLLTSLQLVKCYGIDTLAPLVNHGLPLRLKSLEILNFFFASSDIVNHISPLRQLERLIVGVAFTDNEPDTRGIKMRLGCLPNLKEYSFTTLS